MSETHGWNQQLITHQGARERISPTPGRADDVGVTSILGLPTVLPPSDYWVLCDVLMGCTDASSPAFFDVSNEEGVLNVIEVRFHQQEESAP